MRAHRHDHYGAGKFTTVTSSSYQPTPDQTIGTLTTDDSGDALFIINTATSGGTPALNNVGGIVTTSRSQTDNYTGKLTSSVTTHSYVLEGEPDFGVTRNVINSGHAG